MEQVIIILLGIYILYWGLFYKGGENIWDYLAITGSIYFSAETDMGLFIIAGKGDNTYTKDISFLLYDKSYHFIFSSDSFHL